jgi:hypothetical protein
VQEVACTCGYKNAQQSMPKHRINRVWHIVQECPHTEGALHDPRQRQLSHRNRSLSINSCVSLTTAFVGRAHNKALQRCTHSEEHGGSVCRMPCCPLGKPGGAAETLVNGMFGLNATASGATVHTGSGVGNGASCGRCQLLACPAQAKILQRANAHKKCCRSQPLHVGAGCCSTCDYADRLCNNSNCTAHLHA